MDDYRQYFDISELILKFIKDELTDEERTSLELWLLKDTRNGELFDKLLDEAATGDQDALSSSSEKHQAWEIIVKGTGFEKKTTTPVLKKRLFAYMAAAVFLFAACTTITLYFIKNSGAKLTASNQTDVLPGNDKAVLMLSDGSEMMLDNAHRQKIEKQPGAEIYETGKGSVVYRATIAARDNGAINKLTTPRGGQYEVVLPDGTKVWLNAASSLTYPVTFAANERRVELIGEAYFEVAKNAARPFFVRTARQTVKVLGTHFNIDSYPDEKTTKTTLLEGSVLIRDNIGAKTVKLRPGQQAVATGKKIQLSGSPDIAGEMAWKSGKFLFRNTDLKTIMKMLSRWYNVDVVYQGPVTDRHYWGSISRNVPVSQVFEILKISGINFTISGRTIIVKT